MNSREFASGSSANRVPHVTQQGTAAQLVPRCAETGEPPIETKLTEISPGPKQLRDDLAEAVGAVEHLHDFCARLSSAGDPQAVAEQTLTAVMQVQRADFGKVALADRKHGGLVMVAQRNFPPSLFERHSWAPEADCASARAVTMSSSIIVDDVELDEPFSHRRKFARAAGFRAIRSTPLINHHGVLLGVVSSYLREPGRPSDAEMRLTELYTRQAMQCIERKRSEEESIQLAAIVEASSDFIGIASLAGKAFFLNPAGRRLIGLRDDEPIPEDIREYVATEDRDRVLDEIVPAVERTGFWDGEMTLRHRSTGLDIPVHQHVFFTREPATGNPLTLATVCRDITRRLLAEQAESRAQREIAHATRLQSLGELAASIVHEVNQPLAAIVSNGNACTRWLERELPDLPRGLASLDAIIRDANRAAEIIHRIRTFANKGTTPRLQIDLNEVIREVIGLTTYELRRAGVLLETHLAELIPPVLADRVQLQQVVLNLVINSVEALRPVTDRPRRLAITSEVHAPAQVEVTVTDGGIGVLETDLPRLFEAFFTTKSQGMGLGLAISRRIIESHGGTLTAAVHPGGGLSLKFTLRTSAKTAT